MAVGAKNLVVLAFSGYMCAVFRLVTNGAFIRRGVAISFDQFVELAVDEFEKGGTFLVVAC